MGQKWQQGGIRLRRRTRSRASALLTTTARTAAAMSAGQAPAAHEELSLVAGRRAGALAMSKASGFVLLVAGLSAAAYVVLPSGIDTGEPELPPHFTDVAKIPPLSGASEVALAVP